MSIMALPLAPAPIVGSLDLAPPCPSSEVSDNLGGFLHRPRDSVRHVTNSFYVVPFDHDPNERLGSTGTQVDASVRAQSLFRFVDGSLHLVADCESCFLIRLHLHVDEGLWEDGNRVYPILESRIRLSYSR